MERTADTDFAAREAGPDDFGDEDFSSTPAFPAVEEDWPAQYEGGALGQHRDGYDSLRRVLVAAVEQASSGKGKERHASEGEAFDDQQIVQDGVWMKSNHGQIFQARKKLMESTRLSPDAAKREILGAIVYAAAAYLVLEKVG